MGRDYTLRQEIAVEQRHLDRVYARLAELRQEAQQAERDGYRLVRTEGAGVRLGPANPLTTTLVERDATVFHAARRRRVLDAEHEGLVFGRLDRRDGATHYVGRLGVRDNDANPLVIDWRAPAAADFYQATAADPRGVVRRRMIRSTGETVTGLDDDLLDPAADLPVVGDGALLASISRATGAEMRDIVATIQREQDQAIRSPASGVTVVEGGPGTGKTAVALHRAAYLLYRDRARFAGGILVVGPSPVFVNYIATVLPSLGEQSATLRAVGELVEGVRAQRVDPARLGALKGSLRMLTVLRRAVREQAPGAPTELRLAWRGALLRLSATTLERIRRRALSGRGHRNEVRRPAFDGIFDALWDEVTSQVPGYDRPRAQEPAAGTARRGHRAVSEPAQAETAGDTTGSGGGAESHAGGRAQFEDELTDRSDFRDFLRRWWPLLRPAQVLEWLADPDRLARLGAGVLSAAEVTELAGSFAEAGTAGPTVADVALLDELDGLLGRRPQPTRRRRDPYQVAPGVREVTTFADRQEAQAARREDRPVDDRDFAHVVVDEAQDVSPMQWRMLGRRGRRASWTVVGDPAQSAWSGDPAELARARDAALRGERHSYTLTTNYRNSAEIFERAASVIRQVSPDAPLPRPVRATGVAPVDRLVAPEALPGEVATAATELLDQVEGTVGVITPVGRHAQVAGWLAEFDSQPRLQVVTSLEAKGMEYDGVLLVEPGQITTSEDDRNAGLRTLYVALSRATQRLTTVATSPWRSPY